MFYALGGIFVAIAGMFMRGCALSAKSQCAARRLSHHVSDGRLK
jgi:hypothetical protein